jgi:hypothetical protein
MPLKHGAFYDILIAMMSALPPKDFLTYSGTDLVFLGAISGVLALITLRYCKDFGTLIVAQCLITSGLILIVASRFLK